MWLWFCHEGAGELESFTVTTAFLAMVAITSDLSEPTLSASLFGQAAGGAEGGDKLLHDSSCLKESPESMIVSNPYPWIHVWQAVFGKGEEGCAHCLIASATARPTVACSASEVKRCWNKVENHRIVHIASLWVAFGTTQPALLIILRLDPAFPPMIPSQAIIANLSHSDADRTRRKGAIYEANHSSSRRSSSAG